MTNFVVINTHYLHICCSCGGPSAAQDDHFPFACKYGALDLNYFFSAPLLAQSVCYLKKLFRFQDSQWLKIFFLIKSLTYAFDHTFCIHFKSVAKSPRHFCITFVIILILLCSHALELSFEFDCPAWLAN